jgi:hypothetical protein
LPIMSASGSPAVAALLGVAGLLVCARSHRPEMRAHMAWVAAAVALALVLASALSVGGLSGWAWRLDGDFTLKDVLQLYVWFTWPTLPLACLTVWHWRRQISKRHIAVPLLVVLVGFAASLSMGANERALLTALPPLAVLAAFALPILQRSLGSAIDWFSVFFFTLAASAIWVVYVAVYRGMPIKVAAQVGKLVPGYHTDFSALALTAALLGTILWLGLVRWRTARQAHALWKSLVLPAGGVALCWLLVMTLLLPLIDQAKSYRLLLARITPDVAASQLVCAPDAPVGLLTAMEYFGGYRVSGLPMKNAGQAAHCGTLVLRIPAHAISPPVDGWRKVGQYNQRTHNSEQIVVYRRP